MSASTTAAPPSGFAKVWQMRRNSMIGFRVGSILALVESCPTLGDKIERSPEQPIRPITRADITAMPSAMRG